MADGEVVLVRGHRYGYGQEFDCTRPETKNWVAKYDPQTEKETKVFDRPIHYDGPGSLGFCAFEQMQMSYEGSVLYLLASTYATSGNLAIVNLTSGSIAFVPGVIAVFVIESGPHQNDLIYQRRVYHKSPEDGLEYPSYPFIHALADGRQVREISNETSRSEAMTKCRSSESIFARSTPGYTSTARICRNLHMWGGLLAGSLLPAGFLRVYEQAGQRPDAGKNARPT